MVGIRTRNLEKVNFLPTCSVCPLLSILPTWCKHNLSKNTLVKKRKNFPNNYIQSHFAQDEVPRAGLHIVDPEQDWLPIDPIHLSVCTGRLWKKCVLSKSAPNHCVMCPKVISSEKSSKNEANRDFFVLKDLHGRLPGRFSVPISQAISG